ncbi:HIT family protein [Streptomyces palmae]|uniref:HIT domain-containing protein n=1 Tax=Streptomyces palmae TaxID=1701085 RepID=A0A4Z0HCH1_9ACTN|nr:HIT family protein [Streptomyces palmae]TGB14604.1 HIT domain-containing protein [Streptomyces palmae]
MTAPDLFIYSYGARWQDPPPRHRAAVLDILLTDELLAPPHEPALAGVAAQLTGQDPGVRDRILNTPSAARIIADAVHDLAALRATANGRSVQLLVQSPYGRHRAPAIADAIGHRMREVGARVRVTHHHINRPPVPARPPYPDCPFCQIIHDGAPATIVHEWADAVAIVPRSGGCTNGHLLVLSHDHVTDFTTDPVVSGTVQMRAAELAARIGGQWNYVTSCGPAATQSVFHLHGHLVPRTAGDRLPLPWTPQHAARAAAAAEQNGATQ